MWRLLLFILVSLTLGCAHKPEELCLRNAYLIRYADGQTCERHIGIPWDVLCSPPYTVPGSNHPPYHAWGFGGHAVLEWGVAENRGIYLRSQCQFKPTELPKEKK